MRKIGIFTGTFDPIHEGHVAFIDAAIKKCALNKVTVIPERVPRGKHSVSATKHRVAMAKHALPSTAIEVRALDCRTVGIDDIEKIVADTDELYLLIGTDVAFTLKTWPEFERIKNSMHFVIGIRSEADTKRIHTLMSHLEITPGRYVCIATDKWDKASSEIRRSRQHTNKDIQEYIQTHGLYEV